MKALSLIILLGCMAPTVPVRAQSTGDLIQQLLLNYQKLVSMKSTLQDMYQGYAVIKQGYTDIKHIAEGNFNLHKQFLDGLLAISPAVKNYIRVVEILDMEYSLVKEYKAASSRWHGSGRLTIQELGYIDRLYSSLFKRSMQSIEELTMVLTSDQLRMADGQRLQAIDRVYADVRGQLGFLRQFNGRTSVQVLQREKEEHDLQTIKQLYGNPD